MDALTNYTQRDEEDELLKGIKELEYILNASKLYVEKEVYKLIEKYADYQKEVVTDFRKKSYEKELKYLDKFVVHFSK